MVVIIVFNRFGALVICFGSAGMDLWFEGKKKSLVVVKCFLRFGKVAIFVCGMVW